MASNVPLKGHQGQPRQVFVQSKNMFYGALSVFMLVQDQKRHLLGKLDFEMQYSFSATRFKLVTSRLEEDCDRHQELNGDVVPHAVYDFPVKKIGK